MKSKLLFLALILAVLIFASPPNAKAAVNMLTNPSFEDDIDDDGVPDSWTIWNAAEARIYEVGLPADRVLAEYISDGGGASCGGIYDPADINRDCYINTEDLMLLIVDWMDCTDIANPDCN